MRCRRELHKPGWRAKKTTRTQMDFIIDLVVARALLFLFCLIKTCFLLQQYGSVTGDRGWSAYQIFSGAPSRG
jgi:hypothetical protein